MEAKILRFKRHGGSEIIQQLWDTGLLNTTNETSWQGREPQSCKLKGFKQSHPMSAGQSTDWEITVEYRPPGHKSAADEKSGFWWEQWQAKHVDVQRDGTLLDGKGKPLPAGQPPVILSWQMYSTSDFNRFDFGQPIPD